MDDDLEVEAVEADGVQARLWQDPLLAVAGLKAKPRKPYPELEDFVRGWPHSVIDAWAPIVAGTLAPESNDLILTVLLDGGPYADDHENRLRSRYAVVSALNAARYTPKDSEHLGVVRVKIGGKDLLVPFEYFVRGIDEGYKRVLVLWIDENQLGRKILERCAAVAWDVDAFQQYLAAPKKEPQGVPIELAKKEDTERAPVPRPPVRVLGPTTSTKLLDVLRETFPPGVSVVSTWATMSDTQILKSLDMEVPSDVGPERAEETARAKLAGEFVALQRTIGTDFKLALRLVKELCLRDCCPLEEGNRIALVAEWDTHYGRAWEQTFQDAIEQHKRNQHAYEEQGGDPLDVYTYMRGMDGRLPGKEQEAGGNPGLSADGGGSAKTPNQPQGRARFDYTRRLASKLRERKSGSGGGRPKAIGVLGSDVYDKLLLLRALRPVIPDAVFFTTDLDARLLHPAEYDWARNVLVASHFPLEADHPRIGRERAEDAEDLPPFRGSYQTSLYHGCLAALGESMPNREEPPKGEEQQEAEEPHVYEIGLRKAHDLDAPRRPFEALTRRWPNLAIAIMLALFVLTPFVPALRRRVFWSQRALPAQPGWRPLLPIVAAAVVAFLLVRIVQLSGKPDEEPFALFEGVSAWPTVLLRLLGFGLAIASFLRIHDDVRRSDLELSARYFGGPEPAPLPDESRWRRFAGWLTCLGVSCGIVLRALWRAIRWVLTGIEAIGDVFRQRTPSRWRATARYVRNRLIATWRTGTGTDIKPIWEEYLRRGTSASRALRVLPLSVAYFLFGFQLILLTGRPMTPIRGDESMIVNKVILLGLTVPALIVLLFLILDATRLCERFVSLVKDVKIRWPEEQVEAWKKELRLGGEEIRELKFLHLVAERTAVITRLIYYPFLVVLVMILSRHHIFDNWSWPVGLVIIFVLNFAAAIAAAIILRRTAESARAASRGRLREVLAAALADPTSDPDEKAANRARVASLRHTLEQIDSIREGAFATWVQNPVIRAVLIPFGGVGTLALLEAML